MEGPMNGGGAVGASPASPAPPPAGGAAPAAPLPQAGLEAMARKEVKDALSKLKAALPRLAPGSDIEKAVLKALNALSPVAKDAGEESSKPGAPMQSPAPRPAFPGAAQGQPMGMPGQPPR
jgi:hypothetical protein